MMATLFGMDRNRIITVFLVMIWSRSSTCVITDVQLVGGPDSNKGTIEIKIDNGIWETVCGTNTDVNDVIVICRQLGFEGANRAIGQTPYGHNSTPPHQLVCDKGDTNLSDCSVSAAINCSEAGAASCHGEEYLGCFVDEANDRVLSGNMNTSSSMSISYCIQFCQGFSTANYTYAGVENENECYCGEASDNYNRLGVGSDENCQHQCKGDHTESCGGVKYVGVFNISAAMTRNSPTTISDTSQSPTTSLVISSSFVEPRGTSSSPVAEKGTGVYAGIGGGVAAVVIITILVTIVCFIRKRSQQRTKGIASSQTATLTTVSRPPAYDEINHFGIPNGAVTEASSARSFQPGAQAHSNASSSRGDKNVLLVNLNPRKSSNIYEGTMDASPEDELTSYTSRGTTATKQNSNDRLSVLYAMPGKNGNEAQGGYDAINLGIAPYSSFENPKQPTATAKMADKMSVVYAAPDKNRDRNGTSEDMDSLYAMPDKNGNRNNPSDDTSDDVGSLYAMPDKSRGKPDGYDGDQDLYAKTNDSLSGDQYNEMDMVENELYAM